MELTKKSSWTLLRKTNVLTILVTKVRLAELEIVETDDPKPPRRKGRKFVTNNFSEIEWSKNVDTFINYKFEENTEPSTVMSAEKLLLTSLLITNRMLTEIVNETNR